MFVLDLSGIQNTILFEFKGWHTFHTNFGNSHKHIYKTIYVGKSYIVYIINEYLRLRFSLVKRYFFSTKTPLEFVFSRCEFTMVIL